MRTPALPLLCLLAAAPALASNPVTNHRCEAKPLGFIDPQKGTFSTFKGGSAVVSAQEGSKEAFSNIQVAVANTHTWEVRLVETTSVTSSVVWGRFDIYRDGTLECNDCIGYVGGLNAGVGSYFKLYVGTPTKFAYDWHFVGEVTSRFDY